MSQVQNNTHKREQIPSKPSQVLSVAPVTWWAFRFIDSQGQVDVGFAAEFGTSVEDGEPNVIIVQPATLKQLFDLPHKHILQGVRSRIKEIRKTMPDIPESSSLGEIDLGEIT